MVVAIKNLLLSETKGKGDEKNCCCWCRSFDCYEPMYDLLCATALGSSRFPVGQSIPLPPKTRKHPSGRHGRRPMKGAASRGSVITLPPSMNDMGFVGEVLMNGMVSVFSPSSFSAPRRRFSAPSVVLSGKTGGSLHQELR